MSKMKADETRRWLTALTVAIIASKAGSPREHFLFQWFEALGGFKACPDHESRF